MKRKPNSYFTISEQFMKAMGKFYIHEAVSCSVQDIDYVNASEDMKNKHSKINILMGHIRFDR